MKKLDVQFKTQKLIAISIRLMALSAAIYTLTSFLEAIEIDYLFHSHTVAGLKPEFGIYLAAVGALILLALMFIQADVLAARISKDSSSISIKGNPDLWIIPILQLMGLSLIIANASAIAYVFLKNFQFSEIEYTDFTEKKWAWDLLRDGIRLLCGLVLLLRPSKIAKLMTKFSE